MRLALDEEVREIRPGALRAPDRAVDLRGTFEDFRASEVFDYLAQLGKSGRMTMLERGGQPATAMLLDGQIVAAESGHLRDVEAALTFLEWKAGWFELEIGRPQAAYGEGWNVRILALEAARLADELGRHQLPSPASRLTLAARGPLEDPLDCGLAEVAGALEKATGLTVEELEGRIPLCAVKVRLALVLLREAGRLVELDAHPGRRLAPAVLAPPLALATA